MNGGRSWPCLQTIVRLWLWITVWNWRWLWLCQAKAWHHFMWYNAQGNQWWSGWTDTWADWWLGHGPKVTKTIGADEACVLLYPCCKPGCHHYIQKLNLNHSSPKGVIIAVLGMSSGATGIWWYTRWVLDIDPEQSRHWGICNLQRGTIHLKPLVPCVVGQPRDYIHM